MNEPNGINPTAVYTSEQVYEALGIGESKLNQLVADDLLVALNFTSRRRFWGEELIRFCRAAAHLPEKP